MQAASCPERNGRISQDMQQSGMVAEGHVICIIPMFCHVFLLNFIVPRIQPVAMPEASSRHSSLSSDDDQFHDSRSRSPTLAGLDSTSALILLHDEEDSGSPFDFSDEDDDSDEPLEATTRPASSILHLSPSTVFLYLLSPYLSLGALLLPSTSTPLKYGLGAMVLFAALSVFVRQIWYMLARYMRTTSMEDVIVDAFARGRGKEKPRRVLRNLIRFSSGSLRVLLAAIYLQGGSDIHKCYGTRY